MPSQEPSDWLRLERLLWDLDLKRIAGVDEAGLGPLAGPVVAAAVVFPVGHAALPVNDSKKLSARRREQLDVEIRAQAQAWFLGVVEARELDEIGARKAGLEAMRRAVRGLDPAPDYLLVDARTVPDVSMGQSAYIRADTFIHCVAAASILAKVHRDSLMQRLADHHPGYGFERHMGYGTRLHMEALGRLGPCDQHRRSFAPVARAIKSRGGDAEGG